MCGTIRAGFSPGRMGTLRALRPWSASLSSPTAPGASAAQAKPSGPPGKRTRKAKATQAGKLRNSAKGKVPKSALGKRGKGRDVLCPGSGCAPGRRGLLRQNLKRSAGVSRIPTVRHAQSRVLGIQNERNTLPHLSWSTALVRREASEFQSQLTDAGFEEDCFERDLE